ncbi:MAG: hypothetical protein M1821_002682 [Bathelium mastoideum]|nr:MAG: hypothetical protein M1821_002682 [Bathelium mastoideum]
MVYETSKLSVAQVQCSPGGDEDNVCGDRELENPKCPNGDPPSDSDSESEGLEAFSNPLKFWSKITFCNRFFNMANLATVTRNAKKNPGDYANNLWNYQNQARVMFHEMTHLNYFMNAPASSPYVDDLHIRYKLGKSFINKVAYGPEYIKMLANWQRAGRGGFYTQRNGILNPLNYIFKSDLAAADSYAWFAVAKYVESQIGRYPSEPSVKRQPSRSPYDGDNKPFAAGLLSSMSSFLEGLLGALSHDINDTESSNNASSSGTLNGTDRESDAFHKVPGCADHPVQRSSTSGEESITADHATTQCSDSSSNVPYSVFYGGRGDSNSSYIFDDFCLGIDSSSPSTDTYNIHGKLVHNDQSDHRRRNVRNGKFDRRRRDDGRSTLKARTPSWGTDAYKDSQFQLSWNPNVTQGFWGCGQNPRCKKGRHGKQCYRDPSELRCTYLGGPGSSSFDAGGPPSNHSVDGIAGAFDAIIDSVYAVIDSVHAVADSYSKLGQPSL